MTQALPLTPSSVTAPSHYRLRHVVKSEIVKVLTLPSTAITLGVTVVAGLLVTGLVTNSSLNHDPHFYDGFDPTQNALTGLIVAGLTGGVFGALLITGEYSSGTIRASLAATPRRPVLLIAKLGVTAVAMIVFCEILSFAAFWMGEAILSGGGAPSASLGSPGAFRAVWMTGLFIALLALMSFGFGLVFRSTAAAISAFVAVVFVLPLVIRGISESATRYTPTRILVNSIMNTTQQGPPGGGGPIQDFSPGVGLLLMAVYAAIALAAGAAVFMNRDA